MNALRPISIVIPTRNRSGHIVRCLESLVAQDLPGESFEIIVADDGSTDETPDRVQAIASVTKGPIVRYLRCDGGGANAARNMGIERSSGDMICFVDDDILAPVHWLSCIVAAVVRSKAEVVWGPVFLPPSLRLPGRHRREVAAYLSEAAEPEIPLLCNMAVRKEVFVRGLFDPQWSAPVEEIEWLLRTAPSKTFAADAWLHHNKGSEDCTASRVLRLAWNRGIESGRFDHTRTRGQVRPVVHAAIGALRSVGHAMTSLCVGGLLVAAGRIGYLRGYAVSRGGPRPVTP